jgi:2-oxoisovalerate dehydrogenase E2 component (dihydrolipoyl transacylase)
MQSRQLLESEIMSKQPRAFLLPDLGEGLMSGEIAECHIKVGDHVEADQIALVIETTKASVEVPLPFGGEVIELHGKLGDIIPVGAPLVTLLTDECPAEMAAPIKHLVGQRNPTVSPAGGRLARTLPPRGPTQRLAVTPAVRRLARETGVDLARISGTGLGGVITLDDVQAAGAAGAGSGSL